tara:strand:+ start:350 stop:1321 length:972 start_codon:yes stop_codon:yes gene_type:complete
MKTRTKSVYDSLKEEYTGERILKLYSADIEPRIYLSIDNDGLFALALRSEASLKLPINSSNIGISYIEINGFKHLQIVLLETRLLDIFYTICEDFSQSISHIKSEFDQASQLISRFISWCDIFKKSNISKLTKAQQIGLYGELTFLENILGNKSNTNLYALVESWLGPEGSEQDFKIGTVFHEIKCITTRRSYAAGISSERQLEVENNETLNLVVYIVDREKGFENNLNNNIERIRTILSRNPMPLALFNFKLLECGYFEEDASHYEGIKYELRETKFYFINPEFPRIVEKNLPSAIFNVRYSLQLEGIEGFLVETNYDMRYE